MRLDENKEEPLEFVAIPPQLDERDLIEMADVPSMASDKDWSGYPETVKKHKERNNPRFIQRLIKLYSQVGQRVYDPMCGIGTMLCEANKLGRAGFGWELRAKYRNIIRKAKLGELVPFPETSSTDLVITSPSYWRMNKSPGKNARSKATAEKVGSGQGTQVPHKIGYEFYDLSHSRTMGEWVAKCQVIISKIVRVLKPKGYLVWVIRERIEKQESAGFVRANLDMLKAVQELRYLGWVGRKLDPGPWQRLGGKKFHRDTGRNPVYGDLEYALVFKRKKA